MIRASASADETRNETPVASKARLEARGQVDRRVGRGQEADEGQADLGDRQEPPGLGDQALDPGGAPIAFVGELLDPRSAHRHERDLGRHEDALEEGQDHDHDQLAECFHLAGPALGWRFQARLADPGGHAHGELAGRHIAGHDGPGPGPGALPDRDRGDEHRVDADERAVADRGRVLRRPVVVGGDRARPDVDARYRPRCRRDSSRGAAWNRHRGGCS